MLMSDVESSLDLLMSVHLIKFRVQNSHINFHRQMLKGCHSSDKRTLVKYLNILRRASETSIRTNVRRYFSRVYKLMFKLQLRLTPDKANSF